MPESNPLELVVLISGSGSNLQAFIDAIQANHLNAKITAVISNDASALGLERAKKAGIPAVALPHKNYTSRDAFDNALKKQIDEYNPDMLILAGFMRILTDEFVDHYAGKMLNIHPSLLPKYPGLHTHERALAAGDQYHGTSIHIVTSELDGGPIIAQWQVPIEDTDTPDSLQVKVQAKEHLLYPEVTGWFADGRLTCADGQLHLDGTPLPTTGILFTGESI